MKLKNLIVSMFLLILPLSLRAEPLSSNELLGDCEMAIKVMDDKDKKLPDYDYVKAMACYSYIAGVDDMHNVYSFIASNFSKDIKDIRKFSLYCIPKNFTMSQGIQLIVNYLKQHPNELNLPAVSLIVKILRNNFPCEQDKNNGKTTETKPVDTKTIKQSN